MSALPTELLPDTAEIDRQGRLSIGGVDLLELCRQVGTPVFVYDEEHVRRRCREAVAAFGDGVAYASKAFFCLEMARLAHQEGMWIDTSTGGETHLALKAGVPGERLVLHGNNKSDDELRQALDAGVGRIVVDSFDEIDRLERMNPTPRPQALVRVNPGVEAHTHVYVRTGQDDSKFGLSIANGTAAAAVARLRRPGSPVTLVGIHAHIGSQIFELSSFERAIGILARFFRPSICPSSSSGAASAWPMSRGKRRRRSPIWPPRCARPRWRPASRRRCG